RERRGARSAGAGRSGAGPGMRRGQPFAVAAFGARGTGKTAWCLQQLDALKPRRLMVWDYKHDHTMAGVGQGFTEWPAFVAACCRPTFAARYLPSHGHDMAEQFAAFCELAWREGNLLMLVDELAEVTKASKAPAEWRRCVNVGRSYDGGMKSLSIMGMSQRPAEVDKSFIGNCDTVHCGRLGYASDAKAMASAWGIAHAELMNLPDLHWVEKRADRPELARGVLQFSGASKGRAGKPKGRA
ncbi:MAG: hypothetical protein J0L58_16855, partial [Burkholderiales bacterium]|nr:hypothetical protein [Burkholderiales bacterium]